VVSPWWATARREASSRPSAIDRLVYLDAFVPEHGQSISDLIPPERWSSLKQLAESEGEGWLLPRWSPAPWESIVRDAWQVTDVASLQWVLARLRPTPIGHFIEPLELINPHVTPPKRAYIRCRQGQTPAPFDKPAAAAQASRDWTYREMQASHIPYITRPTDLAELLLEVCT
jgi:hypothetical protein